MVEIWHEINNFSNYLLSNTGKIKAKERKRWNSKCYAVFPEKELRPNYSDDSVYPTYGLISDITEKSTKISINKLIITHLYNLNEFKRPIEFYQLYHIDKNISNLNFDNLYIDIKKFAIRMYDYEGNFLKDYASTSMIQEEITNFNQTYSIIRAAKGSYNEANGFQFRFLKDNPPLKIASLVSNFRPDTVPVAKYFDNRLICVYNSITEASENNKLKVTQIWESLDTGKIFNGFLFKRVA